MAGRRIAAGGTLVLDSAGLSGLAVGDARARGYFDSARERGARVAVSAITLTETLRGGPRDAAMHRVLSRITVIPVTAAIETLPRWARVVRVGRRAFGMVSVDVEIHYGR